MIDLLAWRTAFGNWLETSKAPAHEAIDAIEVAATFVEQVGLDARPLWQLATKARQARSLPFPGIRMALRQQGFNIDDSRLPELFDEACRLALQAASLGTAAEQTAADLPEQGRTEPNGAEPTGDNAENLRATNADGGEGGSGQNEARDAAAGGSPVLTVRTIRIEFGRFGRVIPAEKTVRRWLSGALGEEPAELSLLQYRRVLEHVSKLRATSNAQTAMKILGHLTAI